MSKKVHKAHDVFVKDLLNYKDSATEFLKYAMPQALFRQFDVNNIIYLPGTYVTKELNEFISDIVLKIPLKDTEDDVMVSILVEHKSFVDHFTCLQLLTYIANGYEQQRKAKEKLSVIIPVIYYHGKGEWKFRPLHHLFKNIPKEFQNYIPTFATELFNVHNLSISQVKNMAEGKLRATIMVQKGFYDKVVAIHDYVDVINALALPDTGNFLYAFLVYISNFDAFDQETILEITNQLTTEMKTKSKSKFGPKIADVRKE